jgi:hypothetical protein
VEDIPKEEFALFVDGESTSFTFQEHPPGDPVCLIAVVDNSESIEPGLEQIRRALRKLNNLRKPADELGFVLFDAHNRITVYQMPIPSLLDPNKVDASGELTALWDGILEGLEVAGRCTSEDRYLIVLTDGDDNDSRRIPGEGLCKVSDSLFQAEEVARRARNQGVNICTIGVYSESLKPEPLRSAAYGCAYYEAKDWEDIIALFERIIGDVRGFYRLQAEVPPGARVALRVWGKEVEIDCP